MVGFPLLFPLPPTPYLLPPRIYTLWLDKPYPVVQTTDNKQNIGMNFCSVRHWTLNFFAIITFYHIVAQVSLLLICLLAVVIVLGLAALFLLFVLLSSQRVSNHLWDITRATVRRRRASGAPSISKNFGCHVTVRTYVSPCVRTPTPFPWKRREKHHYHRHIFDIGHPYYNTNSLPIFSAASF